MPSVFKMVIFIKGIRGSHTNHTEFCFANSIIMCYQFLVWLFQLERTAEVFFIYLMW